MSPIAAVIGQASWPAALAAGSCLAILPWLRREDFVTRVVISGLVGLLMWRYILWRWTSTLPQPGLTADFIIGLLFAVNETLALASTSVSLVFLTRTRNRSHDVDVALAKLATPSHLPLVDVFICTYNEEAAILERTIVGALAIAYPNFRVWVLDDSRRAWLKELCAVHGCRYLTRADNAHAKAGNINHALRYVASLPDPPQFVSILDADFVPFPNFLMRAMMLFQESDVGVVQTPQHFVNPDPIQSNLGIAQVWPDEQRYFFDVVMASKDAWGVAFCCGTSSLIRLEPLLKIGGFPTDSVTEDYLLTLRLQEIGYRTVYLNEKLTLGLAPEGLSEYITQRARWCLGFVQICMGSSGPFRFGNHLRLIDRFVLVETFLYWSAAHAFRLFGIIVPILYLMFGIEAVHADFTDTLLHFVPYFVFQIIVMAWLTNWRILPIMADVSQLLAATQIVRAVVQGLTRPKGQKFKVTPKGGDRSKKFVQWPMMRVFGNFALFTAGSIILAFLVDQDRQLQESSAFALFWGWYNLVVLTLACIVCIEQPRQRKADRFALDDVARVTIGTQTYEYILRDISISGVSLWGSLPHMPQGTIQLELAGHHFETSLARVGERDFALAITDTIFARAAMIRYIYSGRFSASISTVSARQVAASVVGRIFR
jgi:cellulose synthase (UDP-forming)